MSPDPFFNYQTSIQSIEFASQSEAQIALLEFNISHIKSINKHNERCWEAYQNYINEYNAKLNQNSDAETLQKLQSQYEESIEEANKVYYENYASLQSTYQEKGEKNCQDGNHKIIASYKQYIDDIKKELVNISESTKPEKLLLLSQHLINAAWYQPYSQAQEQTSEASSEAKESGSKTKNKNKNA